MLKIIRIRLFIYFLPGKTNNFAIESFSLFESFIIMPKLFFKNLRFKKKVKRLPSSLNKDIDKMVVLFTPKTTSDRFCVVILG